MAFVWISLSYRLRSRGASPAESLRKPCRTVRVAICYGSARGSGHSGHDTDLYRIQIHIRHSQRQDSGAATIRSPNGTNSVPS